MLKLIINNGDNKMETKTCLQDCVFYDSISEKCAYLDEYVLEENPKTTESCEHFNDKEQYFDEENDISDLLEGNELFEDWEGTNPFNDIIFPESNTRYPERPATKVSNGANWFVSPDGTFGCWIVHHPKNRLRVIQSVDKNPDSKHYRSPIPLHDHKSSAVLQNIVAWYVDEGGFGRYVLLKEDGGIIDI